jgi:hypothetical protein
MACNVGTLDRALRAVLGVMLIALAAAGSIGAWGYVGVIPLATAVLRFCPAYALVGFKTCETPNDDTR